MPVAYETHYTGLMATCQERHVPLITFMIPPHVFVQPDMAACNKEASDSPNFVNKIWKSCHMHSQLQRRMAA